MITAQLIIGTIPAEPELWSCIEEPDVRAISEALHGRILVSAKRECRWCGLKMGETAPEFEPEADGSQPVTHGICDACRHTLEMELQES